MTEKLLNNIKRIPDYLFSLLFNLKIFPFSTALRLPILLRHDVKIISCYRGCIELPADIHFGMVKIGFAGAPTAHEGKSKILCDKNSKIILGDNVTFAAGLRLIATDGGTIVFGKNSYYNVNFTVQCVKSICFGQGILAGWNVSVRDTDGHKIYDNGLPKKKDDNVIISDDVWLAADVTILKGSNISKGCVVACNSLVCGLKTTNEKSLVAGVPARQIKENIRWEE